MAGPTVADLVRQGRIERVAPDLVAAWDRLGEAQIQLVSSEKLAESDPVLAYLALYDAARKAITAHMQANGYRATNRAGADQAVGLYAEATLRTGATTAHIKAFDRIGVRPHAPSAQPQRVRTATDLRTSTHRPRPART